MNVPEPAILIHQFLQSLSMRNCSYRTIRGWKFILQRFTGWCEQRGITCMSQVTPQIVAAYRRSLFHYRNPRTGNALKFDSQAHYLIPIRRWFQWLSEATFIDQNPAEEIELPKSEKRLPTSVLTVEEVESLMNSADVTTGLGLRDRAIMETFYSSGIRCGELVALDVYDINVEREVLTVRLGKGRKDRVVPVGTRALSWIGKWIEDVRPEFVSGSSDQSLFVSKNGRRLGPNYVSNMVKRYMKSIGITYRGACHLLRHTAATLMMENGADLRSLQEFLGHARLNTTQIYTHVSIQRLQEVHRRTHPAKPNVPKK
ncbi:MAG: site-specific tyrosine recombinase XerC [Planctomycetota bacterium]